MINAFPTLLTVTLLVAGVLAGPRIAQAQGSTSGEVAVEVSRDGNAYRVTAELAVTASVDEVWGVLTDFDHMATFLSSVDQSQVSNREGNRVEVMQKSRGSEGAIRLSLDSVRQIDLTPKREIRSHLLKGDLKSSDFTTTIVPEGETTRITVSGKFVTGLLAGAAITPELVQAQTRLLYQELREEILRRKARQSTQACLLAKNCVRS